MSQIKHFQILVSARVHLSGIVQRYALVLVDAGPTSYRHTCKPLATEGQVSS